MTLGEKSLSVFIFYTDTDTTPSGIVSALKGVASVRIVLLSCVDMLMRMSMN